VKHKVKEAPTMTSVVLLTAAAEDAFIGTSNKHNLQLEYNIGAMYRNRQHFLQQPLEVLLTTRNRSTIYSKSGAPGGVINICRKRCRLQLGWLYLQHQLEVPLLYKK